MGYSMASTPPPAPTPTPAADAEKRASFEREALVHLDSLYRVALRLTGNGHGYRAPITAMARALFTGRRLSQTLPGLENFYMVGQWAGVAGVPLRAVKP